MGSAVSYCKSESVEHESTSPEEVPQASLLSRSGKLPLVASGIRNNTQYEYKDTSTVQKIV